MFYDPDNDASNSTIKFGLTILSLIALGFILLGSLAYQMIGVETIHTFQMSLLILGLSQNYHPYMSNFTELNYSLGLFNSHRTEIKGFLYKNIAYSLDFDTNYLIIAIIQLSAIILYLFITLVLSLASLS